jgi:hypothetical protein
MAKRGEDVILENNERILVGYGLNEKLCAEREGRFRDDLTVTTF